MTALPYRPILAGALTVVLAAAGFLYAVGAFLSLAHLRSSPETVQGIEVVAFATGAVWGAAFLLLAVGAFLMRRAKATPKWVAPAILATGAVLLSTPWWAPVWLGRLGWALMA
jgi:hypothetical protein